ncbi:hypothetical protein FFONT_0621 [Fervidicoccus fontis Kam940]|uniref:Uncharacterized protein n=1 Tax=Fervidicoccus fontis (strain DSM 19380 / JCM 18336 / VKM B-2539 / Kam940) TaxID=1163730 RepID=I0A0V4_FERFK|nr:hypothetical protein FFONT_0621 [Fervidicoccus fontis Kam940]
MELIESYRDAKGKDIDSAMDAIMNISTPLHADEIALIER